METKSEHNGRPYFALKDVGNVTAYYDLKNSVDEAVRTSNFLEKTSNFEEMGKYTWW